MANAMREMIYRCNYYLRTFQYFFILFDVDECCVIMIILTKLNGSFFFFNLIQTALISNLLMERSLTTKSQVWTKFK